MHKKLTTRRPVKMTPAKTLAVLAAGLPLAAHSQSLTNAPAAATTNAPPPITAATW